MNTNLGVLRHLVGRHSFAISIASSLVLGFCGITPAQARGFSTTNFPCAPCKAAPEGYRCKAQVNEKGCPTKINGKAYCTWKDCSAAGNMNNRAPVDVTQSASAARSSGSIAESEQALEEQIAFRDSLDDAQRSAADRRITPDEKSAFDAGLKRADERVNGQSTTAAAPQQNAAMAAGPRRISPEGVYDDPLPANGPTHPSFANPDLQGNRFAGNTGNTGSDNTGTGYEGSGGYDSGSIGSSDYPSFTNPNLHEKPGPTVEAAARLEKGSANKELSTQEVLDQEGRNSGGGGGSFVNSGAEPTGDPCSKASLIDKKFTCSGTQTVIQGAQIMNTIAQTTQSTALGGMGQIKQMEAAQEGTQSAAIKAAADMQELGGQIDIGLGTVNTATGVGLLVMGKKHGSEGQEIRETVTSKASGQSGIRYLAQGQAKPGETQKYQVSGFGSERMENAFMNSEGTKLNNVRASDVRRNALLVKKFGNAAEAEKASAKSQAYGAGVTQLATGLGQVTQGIFNIIAAKKMREAADKLAGEGNGNPTVNPAGGMDLSGADSFAPRTAGAINGNGEAEEAQAIGEEPQTDTPNLGAPYNFAGPPTGLASPGPAADPFKDKEIANQNGSGGAVGLGSTSSATGEPEPGAKMAANEKATYEGGGGGGFGRGGGGGGGDKGLDLSALKDLFGKKEQDLSGNGILAFGDRGPASEPNSILGRNSKSLFARISEVNQDKFKRGQLK